MVVLGGGTVFYERGTPAFCVRLGVYGEGAIGRFQSGSPETANYALQGFLEIKDIHTVPRVVLCS